MGVFASPKNVPSPAETATVSAVQLVNVVTVTSTQTIVTQPSLVFKSTACSAGTAAGGDLVQGAGAINLNQPASCFSLSSVQLAAAASLAVVAIHSAVKIVVASHVDILALPSLIPQPFSQSGALPIMVFAAFGVLVFEEKKAFQKIIISFSQGFKKILTIYQLQVIRC
jgi:hypothetical protein